MWGKIGWFVLFLIIVNCVSATDIPGTSVGTTTSIDTANKYLSAEVSKQIQASKDDTIRELKAYQDENFQMLDSRMSSTMQDVKMKTLLGVSGVALIVNALAAIIISRTYRKYSYEKYQEGIIGKQQEQMESLQQTPGMQQMQQPVWDPQQPQETVGMYMGQSAAFDGTQMNAWQAQPAYAGAWKAPLDAQPDYDYNREPEVISRIIPGHLNDPLQSPEWGQMSKKQQWGVNNE